MTILLDVQNPVPITAKAVVFDLDGVLVDSGPWWKAAERRAVTALEGTWNSAPMRAPIAGQTSAVAATLLAEHHGLEGLDRELSDLITEYAVTIFTEHVGPIPHARRAMLDASTCVPTAVATNSPRRIAEASLVGAGLIDLVRTLVTESDVPRGKPDPAVYLRACEEIGIKPQDALAIDDTTVGLEAAVRAGMKAVQFGSATTSLHPQAVATVPSWSEITFSAGVNA